MKPTIIIADDHQIFLNGLHSLLDPHYTIVARATDGNELIDLALKHQPDLVVSDLSMPKTNGITAIRTLRNRQCRAKFILLTMHMEPEYASAAIKAGASAYILKHTAPEKLLTLLGEVLHGKVYIPSELTRDILEWSDQTNETNRITERQREIIQLLAQGLIAKEIGAQLNISPRTVEYHKYQAMKKLGLTKSAELIHFAAQKNQPSETNLDL
ncbi:response regulator transcription factor [Verrucomicrobiaceae bacterium N1E253]|uniref:Response regulator transcription factor n=1 Tax=Oceaniferula marina TaxID=2748318 RepID=A0A851GHY4_9BACT|nr:response regulator transcription factor [Oceaniferula marina]NWK56966.1 response regulator transcription factor [Oceaniferula marina]